MITLKCSRGLQVGALSGGLAGALWSPDGNLLCLVALQGQLLLMNKVCTPLHSPCFCKLGTHPAVGLQIIVHMSG